MVADLRPLAAVLVSAVAIVLIVASHRRPNLREGWSVLAALAKFGIIVSMLPAVMDGDRKSTRLNSSHVQPSRMPSSA